MDIWAISDSESLRDHVCATLKRQAPDCSVTEATTLEALSQSLGALSGFSGIVFLSISGVERHHLEQIRRIRATVSADTKIVVVTPSCDSSAVIKSVRAGASDFLCHDSTFNDELSSLISRVKSEHIQSEERGRVTTVLPCQATSDASLLAVNIAAVWAESMGSCGLLDFHFRGGDLAVLMKQEPRHTVLDLLIQSETIDESMLQQAVSRHESGVELLAAPPPFADMWNIRLQACQEIIALAQQRWPAVIISCEDVQHAEQIQSVAMSDNILLTMRLDVASLFRTQKHVEFLTQKEVPLDKIHIVAMGTGHAGELPQKGIKKLLNISQLYTIPDDPSATTMSVNVGNPLVLELPQTKPARSIKSLAESLVGSATKQPARETGRTATAMKAAALLAVNTLPAFR